MLKIAFNQLINHIQSQNTWAQTILQPHAGELIQFQVGFLSQSFVILETGALAIAGDTQVPETIVSLSPSTLFRLIAKDASARSEISIKGNTSLASNVAKVLENIQWDITDDLSRVIGTAPAQTISEIAKTGISGVKDTSSKVANMLAEYLQEEAMVIAKPRHVTTFNAAVDTLREDVERFEKQLNQLQIAIMQKTSQTEPK